MANDASIPVIADRDVDYYLRDLDPILVEAWSRQFAPHKRIKVSKGDLFSGAPAVDAVVSPSNSFGMMEGGIDGKCRKHFGLQIQNRLQEVIQIKQNGELLVGQAVIIPAYVKGSKQKKEEKAIKYLIVAPTMRIVCDISATVNSYLSFKAVLLAVREHNLTSGNTLIKSVLVPGLGTGHGKMPKDRCAYQMLQAYETFVKEYHPVRVLPETLKISTEDHKKMSEYCESSYKCFVL